MMKHELLAAFAIMVFLSGCVSDNVSLGCCLRANVSDSDPNHLGCVLYNTTDYTNISLISNTTSCDLTNLNCNVTLNKKIYTIPICSGNELVSCIAPECTAMVCGDFAFTPRSAPGYSDMSDASGNVPATQGEGEAINFYKGQCKFLPMDAKLNKIMKSSKSQLNVFRIGVGGSFDEFEQYRYFFPMSDKFCNINPPMKAGDRRVDRYMNYLAASSGRGSSFEAFSDPIGSITTDCLTDATAPPPFKFSDMSVIPDVSNYKTTLQWRVDYSSVWNPGASGFYQYTGNDLSQGLNDRVSKKVDDKFYRKSLAIAHVDDLYGTNSKGVSRAEFECDSGSNDCYSGSCDTTIYNRGVMIQGNETDIQKEIITDCNKVQDEVGLTKVICAPTTKVVANGASEPTISTVKVRIQPVQLIDQRTANENPNPGINSFLNGDNKLYSGYWNDFPTSAIVNAGVWGDGFLTDFTGNTNVEFYLTKKRLCTNMYFVYPGSPDENDTVNCSRFYDGKDLPNLGGAVFFGKSGADGDKIINYQGSDIIGYALATPDDINDLFVVKNCGIDMTPVPFDFPKAADITDDAKTECVDSCAKICAPAPDGSDMYDKCTSWCGSTTPDPSTQPCMPSVQSKDVVMVDVPEPKSWQVLMHAFEPYYEQRIKALTGSGFSDGCGGSLGILDGVITSMPWVVSFNKGAIVWPEPLPGLQSPPAGWDATKPFDGRMFPPDETNPESIYMKTNKFYISSVPAQAQRERNLFDDPMADYPGTSSCELRRQALNYWSQMGQTTDYGESPPKVSEYFRFFYSMLYSEHLYLFKYNSTTKKIGNCAIDETTLLPVVKTLGWCKSCTTSTLALQNISAYPRVYMPSVIENPGVAGRSGRGGSPGTPGVAGTNESLCTVKYDSSFNGGLFTYTTTDNVSCFNPHISDLQDYKETIGLIGSPRTIPEATIIKERAGDYMKSGILPVFDMSNPSNWIKTNPDCAWDYTAKKCTNSAFQSLPWDTRLMGPKNEYLEYDFQRLFANMGASIVIIDHVKNTSDLMDPYNFHIPYFNIDVPMPAKIETLRTRAEIIKDYCPGCLVAFHVDKPLMSKDFGDVVAAAMSDPVTRSTVDLVTFDYSVTDHAIITLGNESRVVDDLSSYGLASLSRAKKPTMVVGFSVADEDPFWKDKYSTIFDKIVEKQDKLVKSGIIGIIYAPARSNKTGSYTYGLVSTDSSNVGSKGAKFCAFQQAMYQMSTIPPNAMISKTGVSTAVNCTACTALDMNQPGVCGPAVMHSAPVCDDGVECTVPSGMNVNEAKCPEQTIAEPCRLCSDTSGTYKCTKIYGNGTKEHLDGSISDLKDDKWMDVLAGLPKPDKCCIESANSNYTYTKQSFSSSENKPLVFSKIGDPNVDCGFGTSVEDAAALSTFCNVQVSPFKDYDINCCVNCAAYPD